jgi:TRAP-type mannitol/chloroaromatic compound transport system permease small subunit
MMTGAHFALGIAYVLREGQHVRVDFLYARLGVRARAAIDLLSQALFLAPLALWLSVVLAGRALQSFQLGEVSGESAWNPLVWPVNAAVSLGFVVFALQVIAEMVRNLGVLLHGDDGSREP